jgi:hypothetical protein
MFPFQTLTTQILMENLLLVLPVLEREAPHRIIISQVSSILRLASPNLSGFDVGYVSPTSRSRSQAARNATRNAAHMAPDDY